MFDKLRTKIDAHFASSPHTKLRSEFLLVNGTTPREKKSHFIADVVGAAAAFEAMKAFEKHEVHKGSKPSHAKAKEIIAGIASGYAARLIEERDLPFSSKSDKTSFLATAQKEAVKDAKRALRESGLYDSKELEPIDVDEMNGSKI